MDIHHEELKYVYGTCLGVHLVPSPLLQISSSLSMENWFCYTVLAVQQNQCTIDTVTTPRVVVENTGCGIVSVSYTQNQARLRTLSNDYPGLRTSFNISRCSQFGLV